MEILLTALTMSTLVVTGLIILIAIIYLYCEFILWLSGKVKSYVITLINLFSIWLLLFATIYLVLICS